MSAGGRTVQLFTIVAALLLIVTGCSSGGQVESLHDGGAPAAPAKQEFAPEAPPGQDSSTEGPDIVTTGSVRMTVSDPISAADSFAATTVDAGGHVDARTDQSGSSTPSVTMTLRIPSDRVDAVLAKIDDLGVVDTKSINYDDVTSQRVDLDARIKALQTSVNRLLDLMNKATSTEDLLAAESSLTQRQAELDSLQAQRATLGDQISYATITVDLSTEPSVSRVGFVGAIEQGWRALVSTASGLTHLIGFLLPWIPVFLVLAAAFWALRRTRRRRRVPVMAGPSPAEPDTVPDETQ
jgi:hypothetical protein